MRLDVDLGFDAVPGRALCPGEARTLDLHELAGALRAPRRMAALLRDRSYKEMQIREGSLPLSSVQAAALVALTLVRTRRVRIGERPMSRITLAVYAVVRCLQAVPRELVGSLRLTLRVRRAARRRYELVGKTVGAGRAIYLRVDPTLRWLGVQVGGAATHTSGVINGLIDNGVDVEVLAVEQPLDTARATFTQVPVTRVMHLIRGLTYTAYTAELLRAAQGRTADFVYERYQLGSFAGLELARRLRIPLVLEFNGSEIWVERNWMSGNVRLEGPLSQLESRNLSDASLVVVVSKALAQYVVEQGVPSDRVLVNPNGVDVDALEAYRRDSPEAWRERLGQPEQLTVGFIGTFGLWHGVKLLPALRPACPARASS